MASHFASKDSKVPTIKRAAPAGGGYSREEAAYYVNRRAGGHGGGPNRGRRIAIVAAVIVAVLIVAVGTCGVMLYRSAMTVRAQASEAMGQVDALKEALKSGDEAALDSSVGIVQENVAAINAEVHSPLWNLATLVPVVGEDIRSVQSLGEAGNALVGDALVPIADSVSGAGLSDLFSDGAVNVELLKAISAAVSDSVPTIKSSVETISSLPEAHIPQLADVLGRVQGPVSEMSGLVDQLEPVLRLLPQIFGADGQTRTYLVIAQNNSELRATGGLPGSWGTLTVTDGTISLGEFTSILHRPGFNVAVTPEETAYITASIGTDPAQVNFTPNFVRVGELSREYWSQAGGGEVDGVIAIDPVFLQRLLALTGGFAGPDGETIDGTNVAKILLSDTYWRFGNDGDAQDAYFVAVASLAFEHIMGNLGNVGLTDLMDVVTQSAEDGRLLVWMANADEQAMVTSFGMSGEMSSDPAEPVLGVYLNDSTISKISWYAAVNTQVGEGVKNADGTTTYDVTTTVANTITPEEAASAPIYISGSNGDKRDASDMLAYIYFFAPAGGTVSELTWSENAPVNAGAQATSVELYGLDSYSLYIHARSGETLTFSYKVTTSAEATEPLSLRTTPLAQESLMQPLA